jgi:Zinc carboxypeptidase
MIQKTILIINKSKIFLSSHLISIPNYCMLQRGAFFALLLFFFYSAFAQKTPYEFKGKNYTATYEECIKFYQDLDQQFESISLMEMGMTDAGLPLHLVLLNGAGTFDPKKWRQNGGVVILVNNGIHPGEPDGIDASMMLLRDLAAKANVLPDHVTLAVIPVYNIGGCLNRSAFNRVDQNGPEAFGSRGNSQNLDLNRDFIKCDSKEARAFSEIFQWLMPDILIDNHVSDGADYPNVMTLATTQHNKLGGEMGNYLHTIFEPALFASMKYKNFPMIPYVNVWGRDAKTGWSQFFDSPRYSTGYATLFHTFGFTIESHMLKPYSQRVEATYELMKSIIDYSAAHSEEILSLRSKAIENSFTQSAFPLNWKLDPSKQTKLTFVGYEYKTRTSAVSGLPVKYYDRAATYTEEIPFKNYYLPSLTVKAPEAYIIPQGWWKVIELLQLNKVSMQKFERDTVISVEAYTIIDCAQSEHCYEGHHGNSRISVSSKMHQQKFRKGDYFIPLHQMRKRFIIEVLEPIGDDSYFAWNYFDAILVQKEGYSDYAYEDLAAEYLQQHPELKAQLLEKREKDTAFAKNASSQLDFVYKNSPYYETGHNLYPVFRLLNAKDIPEEKSNAIQDREANKKDE